MANDMNDESDDSDSMDYSSDDSSSITESDEFDEYRSSLLQSDLAEVKARRSKVLNLQSLQDLSLNCIHSNLEYFSTKEYLFHFLRKSILLFCNY
jgi:hypothetical protein